MSIKKIGFILISVLVSVIFWRVLSLGLADLYAVSNPERALFWRASHPEALFRMAEKSANNKDWSNAQNYALKAVKSNKLDGRPIRVLAQVASNKQDEKLAHELFLKAVNLSPRDLNSHIWLLEYSLRNMQAAPAVKHLDALLRVNPNFIKDLLPQSMALAVNPNVQAHLIDTLSLNPPWRRHLLMGLAVSEYELDQIVDFFIKLNSKSKLESVEYLLLIDRLNKEGRYMQSYVTWANLIKQNQQKFLGNVFDGGFELPFEDSEGGFAWVVNEVEGAQSMQLSTRGTLGASSFFVDFDGRRVPYAHLSQILVLPPGKWLMSYRAKADRLDNSRGLIWRIMCHGDALLAESMPMQGQFNWKELQFQFEIPEKCQGQRLVLMIPARIPAETLINGSLWLDDVKIQRVD